MFLAWTTTPWTLPSNTALALNKNFDYVLIKTKNQYTKEKIHVVVAEKLIDKVFSGAFINKTEQNKETEKITYEIVQKLKGSDLIGLEYNQLIDVAKPLNLLKKLFM